MTTLAMLLSGLLMLQPDGDPATKDPELPTLQVVCTTPQVADVVRNVGGKHIHVEVILEQEGIDPHTYKPTKANLDRMRKAHIIFYSGHGLEAGFSEALEILGERIPTVALAEALDAKKLIKGENNHINPFVWMDTELWAGTAPAVAKELAKLDKLHANKYKQNGEAYRNQLLKLHQAGKKQLLQIPKSQRVLVTAFESFPYFTRAYGLKLITIEELHSPEGLSLVQAESLVSLLVKNKVKAIFVEPSVSARQVSAILEACKAQGHQVIIGGSLYSETLGMPGTEAATYSGMLNHNMTQLVKSLK